MPEECNDKLTKFELWKEYENIAMHFNQLLIQFRLKALGGIGVIIALLGVMTKSSTSSVETQWLILAVSFAVLAFVWLAIYLLDFYYYNRLLLGAVTSTMELENMGDDKLDITFSSDVKKFIENNDQKFKNLWPIQIFYLFVLIILVALSAYFVNKVI
jgi:hypothetical protein